MKTLARFEFALGRRIPWSFQTHQLKVAPHGMADANAFYSPEVEGLVFGYFDGPSGEHGVHLPVARHRRARDDARAARCACASATWIRPARIRRHFTKGSPTSSRLLSVFSQPEVVEHLLIGEAAGSARRSCSSRAAKVTPTRCATARCSGSPSRWVRSSKASAASRCARARSSPPTPALKDTAEFLEPHRRGELFVAAVMQGFINAWSEHALGLRPRGTEALPGAPRRAGRRGHRRCARDDVDPRDRLHAARSPGIRRCAERGADRRLRGAARRLALRAAQAHARVVRGLRLRAGVATARTARHVDAAAAGLKYDRVRFESMRSDKDEVFRFIWDNRDEAAGPARRRVHARCCRSARARASASDGFVAARNGGAVLPGRAPTPDEMRERRRAKRRGTTCALCDRDEGYGRAKPRTARATPTTATTDRPRRATSDEIEAQTTPLYGGGVLIFDEYGRVKYCVHNDVFGKKQKARLALSLEGGPAAARREDGAAARRRACPRCTGCGRSSRLVSRRRRW